MCPGELSEYIIGIMPFKYLSEKMLTHANKILEQDGFDYKSVDENTEYGKSILEAIKDDSIADLGYFLKSS